MISLRTHKPEMLAHFCHLIFQPQVVCSVTQYIQAQDCSNLSRLLYCPCQVQPLQLSCSRQSLMHSSGERIWGIKESKPSLLQVIPSSKHNLLSQKLEKHNVKKVMTFTDFMLSNTENIVQMNISWKYAILSLRIRTTDKRRLNT